MEVRPQRCRRKLRPWGAEISGVVEAMAGREGEGTSAACHTQTPF